MMKRFPFFTMFFFLLQLIWYYITTYIVGALCLLIQMLMRHRYNEGIPLQTGKVAIVTGGASGIGYHVSKGLVAKNIHVIIAGRSKEQGLSAIARIRRDYPNAKVDFMELNLLSLQSVRDFAEQFLSRDLKLHILVNNAGVMFPPYQLSLDEYESQLQVNFLSHFYLTQLLADKLAASGSDGCRARVVNVSSAAHVVGSPDLDRLGQRLDNWYEYSSHKAYADSKLLVIAGAYKLDSLFRQDSLPVSVCALHPGVVNSGLWKHLYWIHRKPQQILGPWLFWRPDQGADTILYAAMATEVEGESGCYYDNSEQCRSGHLTYDEDFQEKLWVQSNALIEVAKSRRDNTMNQAATS